VDDECKPLNLGYPCIVGAGRNAATLHYERNDTQGPPTCPLTVCSWCTGVPAYPPHPDCLLIVYRSSRISTSPCLFAHSVPVYPHIDLSLSVCA